MKWRNGQYGLPLSSRNIWWKSNDARRRERRGWSVMFFTFFVNNPRTFNGRKWRSCGIQDEIASVFAGRFTCKWGLQLFFWKEKPFPKHKQIVTRWRYDWCTNVLENFQNLRKWVQRLCAPLPPFRSKVKEKFYPSLLHHNIVDVNPCKILCYLVRRRNAKNGGQCHLLCSPKCYYVVQVLKMFWGFL